MEASKQYYYMLCNLNDFKQLTCLQLLVDILVMNVSMVFFLLSGLVYLFRDLYFHKCCTYILLQSCLTGKFNEKKVMSEAI